MAAVIVPRNDEIFKIRGAGVAAGRDLQAGIAPCADDGERQAERGDIQNADVALAVDLAFRHGQLRIQHIIRDKCLLFPLSSGRLEFPIVKDTASDITTPRLYNIKSTPKLLISKIGACFHI